MSVSRLFREMNQDELLGWMAYCKIEAEEMKERQNKTKQAPEDDKPELTQQEKDSQLLKALDSQC